MFVSKSIEHVGVHLYAECIYLMNLVLASRLLVAFSLALNFLSLHLDLSPLQKEAMLFLIGPVIECHSGKPQGAGWNKLSWTQVRLR